MEKIEPTPVKVTAISHSPEGEAFTLRAIKINETVLPMVGEFNFGVERGMGVVRLAFVPNSFTIEWGDEEEWKKWKDEAKEDMKHLEQTLSELTESDRNHMRGYL